MSRLAISNKTKEYVVCGDLVRPTILPVFVALAVICVVYLTALFDPSKQTVEMANAIGPSILLLSMVVAGWKTVQRYPIAAWTGFFWYLVNNALFYGLGPLVYVFGNEATMATMQTGSFPIDQYQLLRTNFLNSVGIIAALLAFSMVTSQFGVESDDRKQQLRRSYQVPVTFVAIAFLSIGAVLRYLLVLPYLFGLTSFVVPGVIMTLGQLFDLGLAVVAFLSVRRGGKWTWLLWTLFPIHISTCLLQFAKSNVALALILTGLGAYLGHRNVRRLSAWLVVASAAIILLQPFAIYGRLAAKELGSEELRPNLTQRIEIAKRYLSNPSRYQSLKEKKGVQTGWTRLCYAGPQTFAMKRYDAGLSADNLKNVWIIAIPRIFWPQKPKLDESLNFYRLATGREGTHVGVTVYGDGYWHFGWLGVVGFGLVMGGVFAVTTRWSLIWVQAGNLLYLPVVLMGIDMAVRGPNNFFIKTIIAPLPIYVAYVVAARISSNLVGKRISKTDETVAYGRALPRSDRGPKELRLS